MKIAFLCTDNEPLAFGMRSLSAVLKARGYQTRLLFLETGAEKFTENILMEISSLIHDYDVVGFSCLAQGSSKAKQILEYIKPLNKSTIWGGVHACLDPEDCSDWTDYVCLGEGEDAILEFVDRLKNSRDCRDMLNLAYKENGKLVKNNLRPLINDLDKLPLPDFSLDNEHHLTNDGIKQVFSLKYVEKNHQIPFISSRGCAFHCTYCCNIKLKDLYSEGKKYVRRMSVGRLIEHSQQLRKIFPNGKYFYFIDEDFAARPSKELIELAERFPEEVGLPFECLAHPFQMNEKKLDLLAKAGLFRVRIGVETGSERTMKEIYNRPVSIEAITRAVQNLSKFPNIDPVYFFIYANPYEEKEDLIQTLQLMKKLPNGSNIQAYELIFFPGSMIFERAVSDGLIKGKQDSGFELNFTGGLHYQQFPWKEINLYLNGLLFLAAGKCSRFRIGSIPRIIFNALIDKRFIDFNDKHPIVIKVLISTKELLWKVRFHFGQFLKRFIKDPVAIYNTAYIVKKKLSVEQVVRD